MPEEAIIPPESFHGTLNKFEKFLMMFSANAGHRGLPAKIIAGKVIDNSLVLQWIKFQALPLLKALVSTAQPTNGSPDHRYREMIKAWIEATNTEIQREPIGDVLADLKRIAGTCRQIADDIALRFPMILRLFAEPQAIKDGLDLSINKIQEDCSGDRFNLQTPAIETVRSQNFFNETYVVNTAEERTGVVLSVREEHFYKMFQDYFWKHPLRGQLMSETKIISVAKMTVRFAKYVGYGIRIHNGDIDTRQLAAGEQRPPYINVFDVVLLAGRALGVDVDQPLAFAVSYMQAYIAAIHLPVEYVRYNQVAGDQFFRWTDRVHMDLGGTAKSFTEKQIRTALAPQDQRGMQFPESCLLWSWNQMSVESGFTKDCVTKRKAADVWEDELNRVSKPLALYNGHDLFPPNPGRHPDWVYLSGRVISENRPFAREPQGPQHPSQDVNEDPWGEAPWVSATMPSTPSAPPQATPAHGPKRARTGEAPGAAGPSTSHPSGAAGPSDSQQPLSSSSQQPPTGDAMVQWAEVPYPEGTVEYTFTFSMESSALCRANYSARQRNQMYSRCIR